jgi:hypothetical protein
MKRTYSQSGQSITLVMKSTGADGKEVTTRMTYQLDGKDHPVSGNPDFDSISGRHVDGNTATFTQKKRGRGGRHLHSHDIQGQQDVTCKNEPDYGQG